MLSQKANPTRPMLKRSKLGFTTLHIKPVPDGIPNPQDPLMITLKAQHFVGPSFLSSTIPTPHLLLNSSPSSWSPASLP